MQAIVFQNRIELSDYKRAQYLHMRSRGYWLIGILLLAIAAVCIAARLAGYRFGGSVLPLNYPLFFVVVYVFLLYAVFLPMRFTRIYKSHKLLQKSFISELTEEGLRSKSDMGESNIPWEMFAKWKASKHILLVYQADNLFHLFPARLFPSAERYAELQQLLTEKIGPRKR